MRILSLFDGMACGHIAFSALGIPIDRYVAYEIDQYAVKTARHNFPDIEEMGDVFTADFIKYQGFDWLIGGSPCTHWSCAKTKNRETEASGVGWDLFAQYLRALRAVKPQCFLYENNKSMAPAIRAQITAELGVEPVLINSALVSAQNRQRLYWVGTRNEDGTYSQVEIDQPQDRHIHLWDIAETSTDEGIRCVAQRGRYIGTNGSIAQHFEVRTDGKTNALTTVQKDNLIAVPVYGEDATKNFDVHKIRYGRIAVKGKEYPIKLADGAYVFLKLTVTECKRLQTVPDTYTFPVSNSRSLRMLGNGWTIEVIKHLISSTLQNKEEVH